MRMCVEKCTSHMIRLHMTSHVLNIACYRLDMLLGPNHHLMLRISPFIPTCIALLFILYACCFIALNKDVLNALQDNIDRVMSHPYPALYSNIYNIVYYTSFILYMDQLSC